MEPHERLDEAMEERRLELGMSWTGLAREAEISPTALRAIRRGDYRPSRLTARHLDTAFRWEPGSVEIILLGGEPTPSTQRIEVGMAVERNEAGETRPERQTEDELENAYDEFEPGSIIRRVEELIRRRKLRELDMALKLVEGQGNDAG